MVILIGLIKASSLLIAEGAIVCSALERHAVLLRIIPAVDLNDDRIMVYHSIP
jgi:hypothetical protein